MDKSEEIEPRFTIYDGCVIEKLPLPINGLHYAYYKLGAGPVYGGHMAKSIDEAKKLIPIIFSPFD